MNTNAKKVIKAAGLSIFFVFILIFGFLGSKDLILGIKIVNVNLSDGQTLENSTVKLSGNAKNAINLLLNGREISIDQEGNFNETIALLPGYNVINITARDKFGYVDEKNYKLIYKI